MLSDSAGDDSMNELVHRKRFAMTDGQWHDVAKTLKLGILPIEARVRIDQCIGLYHLFSGMDEADRGSPKLLKQAAAAAAKLASLLKRLHERERFAIVRSDLVEAEWHHKSIEWRESHVEGLIEATIDQISVIEEYCADGSETDFSKRLNDTGNIEHLLIGLDYVLKQFTPLRMSRGKPVMSFAIKVCALAGSTIGAGTIERTISRLQRRGTFPKKKNSKVTAQKSR